jgi:4-amino-4-deoxy-L-arabinose transferase-like glycosyltransferase
LYPAFLAAVLTLSGRESASEARPGGGEPGPIPARALTAVKVVQAAVGALGVWLIAVLAARAAGPRAGMAAGVISAVYPPLIWICGYALSETLYSALALAGALLLDVSLSRDAAHQGRSAFAAGVVAGLAVLTRPAMIFFVLLAAPFLVVRRRLVVAALLITGALLVVSPWTIRNAREYGRFVLVASEGGVTFWTGNHPLARGEGDLAANPDIKREYLAFEARHPDLTAEQLEPLYYREALGYIAAHPMRWIGLVARKAFYAVVPIGPSYRLHSNRYFVASLLSYGVLLPFAIAGFLRLRHAATQPWPLWLLAASALLVALVFFPQERFRIPVIDPTLIVCAAAWWALRSPAASVVERAR